jgi:hypothetical protein
MEVINIHKKKEQTSEIFNVYYYQKILGELFPKLCDHNIRHAAENADKLYNKLREFDPNVDSHTLIRNIIRQQSVYAEFAEKITDEAIQSDVIILGKKYNWPKFTDVSITRFNNFKYNFARDVLDNHKTLINQLYLTHQISEYVRQTRVNTYSVATKPISVLSETIQNKPNVDLTLLAPISKYFQNICKFNFDGNNYDDIYYRLTSSGLSDALIYCIHNSPKMITNLLNNMLSENNMLLTEYENQREQFNNFSEFNYVQKILQDEYDSSESIFKIIKTKKIINIEQLLDNIPKKDADKIRKIIKSRVYTDVSCSHTSIVRKFIDGDKSLRDKVIELGVIDENSMQYHCNKCTRRAYCQHHLDFSLVRYDQKMDLVYKYKDPKISDQTYYYCKYCAEKIYKNEINNVLTSADFIFMARGRESALSKESNIEIFDTGLYMGVINLLSCFKFDYDFSLQMLAKSVKNTIYGFVHDQVSKLNIDDDPSQYEVMTKLYSFVFAAVYMMALFLKDPKISIKGKTVRKINTAYASFINQECLTRFGNITNTEKNTNIIKIAFIRLRDSGVKPNEIRGKTDMDNILDIIQSPQFQVVYNLYNYVTPDIDPILVFKKAVKVPNPTLGNFHEGLVLPKVSQRSKDLYDHLFGYDLPGCYLYHVIPKEHTILPGNLEYNSEIYDRLHQEYVKTIANRLVSSFVPIIKCPRNVTQRYAYGANYIYDDKGNIIIWVPEGKGKDWTYTVDGKTIYLSKIKKHVDASSKSKVDARNAKIGFVEPKYNTKKMESYPDVVTTTTNEKYEFNKKVLNVINKLDSKYTQYMLLNLGRSEDKNYQELSKGINNAKSQSDNYIIGYCKINQYIQTLIESYYTLKNEPSAEVNAQVVTESEVDYNQLKNEANNLPKLELSEYKEYYAKNVGVWNSENFYFWVLESLLTIADQILKSKSKLAEPFLRIFFKNVFGIERKISKPDEKKIIFDYVSNDLEEVEYDERDDVIKESIGLDEIDYEQDDDDINDHD